MHENQVKATDEQVALLASYEREIGELKEAIRALLVAMQEIEKSVNEKFMPEGEFLGVKFED